MAKHALIGGGTGFIGARLCKHLLKHNYEITVISRMPGPNRITWHELANSGIPKGVNAVINLTGQNVLDPTKRWTESFKQDVWNSRINSSANIVKAIQKSNEINAYINICGVSHYQPNNMKIYTEDDDVDGYDFLSNLCIEWEKAATLPEDAACKTRSVILRTGVVVGREGGMIQSIWLPFMLGLGGPMGSGKQILPWIHLEDLCRLIQYCLENEKCKGPLNAVAPEIVTNGEFSKIFANTLGRPCLFAVPEFIVNLLFGAERATLLLTGAKIQPKCTLATGFQYKYPTATAACLEVIKS